MDVLKKTKKQSEILDFISSSVITDGVAPTFREIGEHFSMTPAAAYYAVKALEKKGCLVVRKDRMRNIVLKKDEVRGRENIPVPFFSREPSKREIEDNEGDSTILLPRSTAEGNVFAFRVTQPSMTMSGIMAGDTAVITRDRKAEDNDVVLVDRDDGESSELRRMHISNSIAEFWAESDSAGIIRSKNYPIYGILIEIRRSY